MFIRVWERKKIITVGVIALVLVMSVVAVPSVVWLASGAAAENTQNPDAEKSFIKWVDFDIPYDALSDALDADIASHDSDTPLHFVELLACLGTKYGGNWQLYNAGDLNRLTEALAGGKTIEEVTSGMKNYDYFREAYGAVLDGFVGDYEVEVPDENDPNEKKLTPRYGLKVFSPIARGYSFSHYDDFGVSRTYGYRRKHLGHDLMGSVGTPVVAVESGYVECVGWNRYGGWRIGIRSFDSKRYYYYAHLRKDHPYNDIYEGKVVMAGDVIGYMGMTGYSNAENINNIDTPHLHFGMQLIFDESQKDGSNEIWIDLYAITKLLEKNRSAVYKDAEKKEYYRTYRFYEPLPTKSYFNGGS